MSNNEAPPVETDAQRAKAEAEAVAAYAAAEQARAEARLKTALAVEAEHKAETAAFALNEAREKELIRLNSDDHHRRYDFGSDVSAASAAKCMANIRMWHRIDPTCDIEIVFNSPGGVVTDGFALFDQILQVRSSGHRVTTGVLGEAASMAGILVQSGEHRWCGTQAWYLIHRASFGIVGKTYTVEDQVEWVRRVEERIIRVFVSRTKLTKAQIKRNWERKDWWLDADQCLELGIVDEIR